MTTIITLECGHAYSHQGPPDETERATEQNLEPAVECRSCAAPRRITNVQVGAVVR